MKEERKEAMGTMTFCLVWIGIAVVLFLFQAHYRLDDFIDGVLSKGTIASLIKITVSLLWILIYFGGFFGFFVGAKQFVTGKKTESQTKTGEVKVENAQGTAADEDKPRR
ncbi:MAG: hypothetical protein ACE5KZ_06335 [Candidatus Scalinduaceae bacterium]